MRHDSRNSYSTTSKCRRLQHPSRVQHLSRRDRFQPTAVLSAEAPAFVPVSKRSQPGAETMDLNCPASPWREQEAMLVQASETLAARQQATRAPDMEAVQQPAREQRAVRNLRPLHEAAPAKGRGSRRDRGGRGRGIHKPSGA